MGNVMKNEKQKSCESGIKEAADSSMSKGKILVDLGAGASGIGRSLIDQIRKQLEQDKQTNKALRKKCHEDK